MNCWVIIHCLLVSCKRINHWCFALVIWSPLQLTSKQWIITRQFTARADLFLKYNVELNDLRKIICLCLWLFKISNGMQDENLRSMAVHAIAEMKWVHSSVTIATKTFKFIPYTSLLWNYQDIQVWPFQLLWQHIYDVIPLLQWHAMHAMLLSFSAFQHTSANFEKWNTQIFSNKYFFSNQLIFTFNEYSQKLPYAISQNKWPLQEGIKHYHNAHILDFLPTIYE